MEEEWTRGQAIGHGTFARVSLAKPTTHNSQLPSLFAVKSCPFSHSASLKNEFAILTELADCKQIVKCYGDSLTVENGERLYNVALEYASGGSLADKVRNLKLLESDVRRYTKSVLKGLNFIHKKGFVHCDVKLHNVLLFSDDNVKIADFGLAKRAVEECDSRFEIRGTPMYMAPETVVAGKQGTKSDVWAVGCMVSEMLTGNPAWKCSDMGALLMKIGVGGEIPDIPGGLSDAAKDFLKKCFVKEEDRRWTAEMLLDHPFVDGEDRFTTSSPRNPFDFPDWESEQMVTVSPVCSPEVETVESTVNRLRQLITVEVPDWSIESSWMTIR